MKSPNLDHDLFAIIEHDGRSFVKISNVVQLIAEGACTWVVFQDGNKILTTKNIGYYERVLPNPENSIQNKFYRIHHKHLINLSYMKKYSRVEKTIYLLTNERIPIAQRRTKEFTSMLRSFGLY